MIRIFLNNIPLNFTTPEDNVKFGNRTLWLREPYEKEIGELLIVAHQYTDLFTQIFIVGNDPDKLFARFSSCCRNIEAAGGVVRNSEGKLLMIFRNGKWDLPKGKVEKGEDTRSAAIREVEEECSVQKPVIEKELAPTYHTYFHKEQYVLKKTHWFEMKCDDTSVLKPQTEEGITEVKWMNEAEVKKAMENTYTSIKELLSRGH